MKPEVKIFTRALPCTFRHIWNAFCAGGDYAKIPTGVAHSLIGLNVPRGMEKERRLVKETVKGVDYYALTGIGKDWLEKGVRGHMRNHPHDAHNVKFPPVKSAATTVKRISRSRS